MTDAPMIASLHIHPAEPGEPLLSVESFHLVVEKGIEEDRRYFGRISRSIGQPTRRQVSLIEREQIAEHAAVLGLPGISPGAVRANVETSGLNLQALLGQQIKIGEARLLVYEPRKPCQKMDAVCAGLRTLMEKARQGVMAEVLCSGVVQVGDKIQVAD